MGRCWGTGGMEGPNLFYYYDKTAISGGWGGIRTRETIHHRLHTFQACAFNRSATHPRGGATSYCARRRQGAETSGAAGGKQPAESHATMRRVATGAGPLVHDRRTHNRLASVARGPFGPR